MGIGTQVDEVVQAVAPGNFDHAINWVNLVTTAADGYTHWKARLSAVTVYTDHGPTQVTLPPAGDGGGRPVAVLDTGGPNWMASKAFCDAVYGSWGVSMNGDGTCEFLFIALGTYTDLSNRLCSMQPGSEHDRVL